MAAMTVRRLENKQQLTDVQLSSAAQEQVLQPMKASCT